MTRCCLALLFALFLFPAVSDAYWQQRVKYDIDVTVIDSIHSLDGKLSVQYFNNSPDTLREVYFHLYYLAFQPGSMMDVRAQEIRNGQVRDRISKLKDNEQGKYRIDPITIDGQQASHEIMGTVMRVRLPKPLLPNTSTTIKFTYFEQIPKQTRRGGWMTLEGVQYSMAQWYPKIVEYDEEGWHAAEYLGREFYGVWGDFDVSITLPSSFTVAASGQCLNPQEVGHGYERIAGGAREGQAMPEEKSGMTTWRFHAENVHDFAWTADETYIHDWTTWRDSITVHAIYKTSVMNLWKNALKYTVHSLQTYSELYGAYPYRNFYNTHAGDGGMEYPQLIMNTGFRSEQSLAGVTAHEVAHQWFYGILANNEIREAYLDEGFTSYATTKAMVRLWGNEQQMPGIERSWLDWFIPLPNNKSDNFRSYMNLAKAGYEEPLVIPHDWLREDVNAGQVYSKPQVILNMLEYTLGDQVFDQGMKAYFNLWKFRHPKLRDFQNVMEDVANTDLDWFFDQWFRSDRVVDYSLSPVKSKETNGGYETTVRLRNREQAVMPIDLLLHYNDGTSEVATIPLAVHRGVGYKKPDTRLFFPAWDWVARTYQGTIVTPKKVVAAEIDPSWRLQDLSRLNNRSDWLSALPRIHWTVWQQLNNNPPIDGFFAIARPIISPLWIPNNGLSNFRITNDGLDKNLLNGVGGVSLGVGLKYGAYLQGQGDLKAYMNTADGLETAQMFEGRITGFTPVEWLGRLMNFQYYGGKQNDIVSSRLAVEKTIRPEYYLVGATHKVRHYLETHDVVASNVVIQGDEPFADLMQPVPLPWFNQRSRVVGIGYNYRSEGAGATDADIFGEASLWSSTSTFMRARLTASNTHDLFWGIRSTIRINGGVSAGDLPIERSFNLQIADPTQHQYSDTYNGYRWLGMTKLPIGMRGGAGLLGWQIKKPQNNNFEWGKSMVGINWDMSLFKVPYIPQLTVELNIGAGWVGDSFVGLEGLFKQSTISGGPTLNVDLKGFLPWQLQGVLDQYAFTPVFKIDPTGKIFLGTSF